MYLCKETQSLLNDQVLLLSGSGAAFKVHYWGVNQRLFDNPVHKHSFFEICYVMDGEGEYTDDGINYPLRKGTHFCSKPGVMHQIRTQDGLFLVYVTFEVEESLSQESVVEAFRSLAEQGEVHVSDSDDSPTALLWKTLLLRENRSGQLPLSAIPSVSHALLLSFLHLFGNAEPSVTVRQDSTFILRQAKLFIRDNLSEPLVLRDIAGYLCVSERHLSRLFSAGINENFTNYVRDARIRKAASLLTSSDLSIKQISEATGFSSVHYFTRVFTQQKSVPPAKFRMKHNAIL